MTTKQFEPPHHTEVTASDPERMRDLLLRLRMTIPKEEFCGVGLILYSDVTSLPIASLRPGNSPLEGGTLEDIISKASCLSEPCHDGFHLVSNDWRLTHVNQYFAPPLPTNITLEVRPGFGARHASALLGSLLPGVICIGVLGNGDSLVVFQEGRSCPIGKS